MGDRLSTQQYLRKVSVIIGSAGGDALEFSDFRVRFAVRRGDLQTPNTATLRIYNLAPETAQRIRDEFSEVVLQAGYEGNFGIIFQGSIKRVYRGRESPTDSYVEVVAADGDSAYNYATVAVPLPAGKNYYDQIDAALGAMRPFNVNDGYVPRDTPVNNLPRGKVLYGMARDVMRQACENLGSAWSIQDGKVNVIPLTSYMPGDVPEITAATGMLGLPQQTLNGIEVKMLLNPSIKIGALIHLNNASVQQFRFGLTQSAQAGIDLIDQGIHLDNDGYYYVMVADHVGDTRGNEWQTEVTCLATNAVVPIGLQQRGTTPQVGPQDGIVRLG